MLLLFAACILSPNAHTKDQPPIKSLTIAVALSLTASMLKGCDTGLDIPNCNSSYSNGTFIKLTEKIMKECATSNSSFCIPAICIEYEECLHPPCTICHAPRCNETDCFPAPPFSASMNNATHFFVLQCMRQEAVTCVTKPVNAQDLECIEKVCVDPACKEGQAYGVPMTQSQDGSLHENLLSQPDTICACQESSNTTRVPTSCWPANPKKLFNGLCYKKGFSPQEIAEKLNELQTPKRQS